MLTCERSTLKRLHLPDRSNPPAHQSAVARPLVAKPLFQLSLFASDKEIDEGKMNRGDRERGRRSQQQAGSQENEYVAAEIQRIARKTVRPRGKQRFLWPSGDDFHPSLVKEIRRPNSNEKADKNERAAYHRCGQRTKLVYHEPMIHAYADESEREADGDHH